MTILLRTITLACALVAIAAITPDAQAQTSSPLSADKMQAKEAAVAAHAARKKACKAQAKEQGLHLKKRRVFIRDCMAKN